MNPRLLFVIDNLSTGGAQRQMVNLAVSLNRRGWHVELFCYAPGDLLAGPLHEAGITIHPHYKTKRFSTEVILALSRLIRSERFDLVLGFLMTPSFYALAASLLRGRARPPVVVSERFCDLQSGVPPLQRFVRQFYRFAAHVTTNSHHQRTNLSRKHPWLRSRLSTIYNGYDLDRFLPPAVEPDNDPMRLLTIASVTPYKNGLRLVEALTILRERHGMVATVDWIGQRMKSGRDLAYLNEMYNAIASAGLEKQWRWLDQRTDIVAQLQQHDALVHPSYGEGLPNAVCEALACGRPAIVSDTLDHANLVQHAESGLRFTWNDPEDLADKIAMFVALSKEARRGMGRRGRAFAENNLSLERLGNEYESLFAGILNRSTGRLSIAHAS